MNFGDIYALVLKEYPDILTVDEMSRLLVLAQKQVINYFVKTK